MHLTPEGLRHLVAVVGSSQVVLGTDNSQAWNSEGVNRVLTAPGLSDADRIAILGGNADQASRPRVVRRLISILSLAVLGMVTPSWAQLEGPNEMGVSFGQWHTIVGMEATKKFWTTVEPSPIKIDGTVVIASSRRFIFFSRRVRPLPAAIMERR